MSTMLHQLRRERVQLTPEQMALLHQAVCRVLLGEVDEVRITRSHRRIRIESKANDRVQTA